MKETFGPLGQYLDRYADYLHERGFARNSVCSKTSKIRRFDRWLANQCSLVNELNAEIIQRYFTTQLKNGRRPSEEDRVAVRQFLAFLMAEDIASIDAAPPVQLTRLEEIEQQYADYLHNERGLAVKSIIEYRLFAKRFLSHCFQSGELDFSALVVNQIVTFVKQQAAVLGCNAAKLMTTALRSFLSYCRYQGYIQADLAAAVPTVAHWSAESLPKSLQRAEVQRVLSCCDRKTDIGMRDYAVLLLLARLGLRAGEISSLRLNDLDWHSGTISVHGKSKRLSVLPLPAEVGKALATYLSKARPRVKTRSVFLRTKAPITGLSVQSICGIVRRALIRAGVESTRKGAHLFRHSLATEMLRRGASLPEIAEVLRHQGVQCTAIYAKVDIDSLRTLGLPWPGGVQ